MKTPRPQSLFFSFGVVILLAAAKCGGGSTYLASGDVLEDSTTYRAVDHRLTSDNYRRWLAAQDALDTADVDATVRLNTHRLTDADIDRAIENLEAQPQARGAIESSGMTVRDYVLTTIALAQSWDAVNRPTVRVEGLPLSNVEFLRRQSATDNAVRERPRARALTDDESDSDSDSDDDSDRRRRKHRRGHGKDSDSDSR